MNNKRNPVGWFEIYVQDMNRARAFYEAVFAKPLEKLPAGDLDMWCWPMEQDCTVAVPGAAAPRAVTDRSQQTVHRRLHAMNRVEHRAQPG